MKKNSIGSKLTSILKCAVLSATLWFGIASVGAAELKFGTSETKFSEGAGVILVLLERTDPAVGQQVTIQTADLSATAGVDYIPINAVFTFDSDKAQTSIPVRVFDNPQFQADREFKLTLSNPVGTTLIAPFEMTLIIADNDEPSVAGPGASGTSLSLGTFAIATNSLNNVIIGGGFSTFNGEPMNNLVRLLPNGNLDPAFDPGAGPNDRVWSVAVEGDDQIVVGGDFTMVGNQSRSRIARLNTDGSVDSQFDPGAGPDALVESLEIMPDGRILLGGFFSKVDDVDRADVAILSDTGALDTSFNAVTPPSLIGHVARLAGDHVLLGGEDYSVSSGSQSSNSLMRLDLTGARDTTFRVGVGDRNFNTVSGIVVQPDNKILFCGLFSTVNGVPSSCIARLNQDGTYDDTFDVGGGADYWVYGVNLQPDGKILISGLFELFDGVPRVGIARLNADGSLDDTFDPRGGANNEVYSALPLSNSQIHLVGSFSSINGYDRFRSATLDSDGSLITGLVSISNYSITSGDQISMSLVVEPGRDFRVYGTEDFDVRTAVITTNTARRSFEFSRPTSDSMKFFYVEQGFPIE